MASMLYGPHGLTVESIRLNGRELLRVRQHRVHLADCATLTELERVLADHGVTLGELSEDPPTEID